MALTQTRSDYQLRQIRRWHWDRYLEAQKHARHHRNSQQTKAYWKRQAGLHLSAVQTLNDFFPVGDTAESDITPYSEGIYGRTEE